MLRCYQRTRATNCEGVTPTCLPVLRCYTRFRGTPVRTALTKLCLFPHRSTAACGVVRFYLLCIFFSFFCRWYAAIMSYNMLTHFRLVWRRHLCNPKLSGAFQRCIYQVTPTSVKIRTTSDAILSREYVPDRTAVGKAQ